MHQFVFGKTSSLGMQIWQGNKRKVYEIGFDRKSVSSVSQSANRSTCTSQLVPLASSANRLLEVEGFHILYARLGFLCLLVGCVLHTGFWV